MSTTNGIICSVLGGALFGGFLLFNFADRFIGIAALESFKQFSEFRLEEKERILNVEIRETKKRIAAISGAIFGTLPDHCTLEYKCDYYGVNPLRDATGCNVLKVCRKDEVVTMSGFRGCEK